MLDQAILLKQVLGRFIEFVNALNKADKLGHSVEYKYNYIVLPYIRDVQGIVMEHPIEQGETDEN